MTELKADVLVLGAGIVGISAALHLQRRGRDVAVIEDEAFAGLRLSVRRASNKATDFQVFGTPAERAA